MNGHSTHTDHSATANSTGGNTASHAHGSHSEHAGHSPAMFRDKFWLSFVLTIPTVVWSPDVQRWSGYRAPSFSGSTLIPYGQNIQMR